MCCQHKMRMAGGGIRSLNCGWGHGAKCADIKIFRPWKEQDLCSIRCEEEGRGCHIDF